MTRKTEWKRRFVATMLFCAILSMVAISLPSIYILSFGPAWKIAGHFHREPIVISVYMPVVNLAIEDNAVGNATRRYLELWDFCISVNGE